MFSRSSVVVLIMVVPLVAAGTAGAGWGWENPPNKTPMTGGALADVRASEPTPATVRDENDAERPKTSRQTSTTHPVVSLNRVELAGIQFASNQMAKGQRSLEQAARESPNDPRVYLMFGSLALRDGRLSDARLNGEKALSLLEATKLEAESVRAIRREAFALLAGTAETVEDWSSAQTYLEVWLALDPKNAAARQRLGRALFSLGKTEAAYQELTQSAQDDPKFGPAAIPMALLFVKVGNDAKAQEWFVYASQIEPRNAGVRLAHARWMLDKNRLRDAHLLVEEAAKLDPKSREIEPLRGLVAWQGRDLTTAERIFETLHRDLPADAGYAALLTLALVDQPDPDKRSRGLKLAEANATLFPNALDVLASLGWAHARSGHRDEAERMLRAAITRAGGQATPTLAYFLAQVLAEKGQTQEAESLLQQGLAIPIVFAYQVDARELLKTLAQKSPATPAASGRNRAMERKP